MLDLRFVVENLDEVRTQLARRGSIPEALDSIRERSDVRKKIIAELEQLRAKRNEVSAQMASVDKKSEEFAKVREAMKAVGDLIKTLEPRLKEIETELETLLLYLPNLPHETTPDGKDEHANVVVKTWGEKPSFAFVPKDHVDLGTGLGIVDFERAVKISGARFSVLQRAGSQLERSLMMFMLDTHTREHGYIEVWPPVLIKEASMRGTGQLPKFEKDAFQIAGGWDGGEGETERLFLAPTAEVPVTNLHADEIFEATDLPRAYTAYTACFRSEAGSYGKDTRGLIRQHQFDKVELVRFVRPEDGPAELEKLTGHACTILEKLQLHYRVVSLCTGDLGNASRKTYDLEVWLPGQNAYREISSCSWFGEYQSRRAKIRYRPSPSDKPQLVHTLNGSGLAIGRTLVAILEQYQQADGSVIVPEVLRPYMGGLERIQKP